MTPKFWLLQAFGWSLFLAIAYVARPSEAAVADSLQFMATLALSAAGLAGSLALRWIYRRLQADGYGEVRWLGILFAASVLAAVTIDLLLYVLLWLGAGLSPVLAALQQAQPPMARAPLLAVAYIAWSLLYLAISRQTRLQQAARTQRELQLALKDAQLQRLLGQLNPHFAFNALNNIRALILIDPEAARAQLTRFAATLRYQFSGGDDALVSVHEELEVVRDYLGLVGLQLGARLRYREQVDPQALAVRVPRFCLQLLVENAIKHGLGPSSAGGDLQVCVALQRGDLQLEVRNTGQLRHDHGQGTGLNNLRQRLLLSFGPGAGLRLAQEEQCVVASVWIGVAA
ncbi:histidine kinase [Xanthomonas sp. NCPPB 1128]|uniref:sensor histidine kinase n=1 Tax=Xanthomonas sp. NCPPB 1128 TaxID=1775876 RepID=UPI00065AA9EC|nr:histidine kinase [Xanthomonas sp. NCPPB 1128]KMM75095.1 histidine kinase [Xanthomonas sp. NCPPB 1128]